MKTVAECKQGAVEARRLAEIEMETRLNQRDAMMAEAVKIVSLHVPEELRDYLVAVWDREVALCDGNPYISPMVVQACFAEYSTLELLPNRDGDGVLARYYEVAGITKDEDGDPGERYYVKLLKSNWTTDIEWAIGKAALAAEEWAKLLPGLEEQNRFDRLEEEREYRLEEERINKLAEIDLKAESVIEMSLFHPTSDVEGVIAALAYELRKARMLYQTRGL